MTLTWWHDLSLWLSVWKCGRKNRSATLAIRPCCRWLLQPWRQWRWREPREPTCESADKCSPYIYIYTDICGLKPNKLGISGFEKRWRKYLTTWSFHTCWLTSHLVDLPTVSNFSWLISFQKTCYDKATVRKQVCNWSYLSTETIWQSTGISF